MRQCLRPTGSSAVSIIIHQSSLDRTYSLLRDAEETKFGRVGDGWIGHCTRTELDLVTDLRRLYEKCVGLPALIEN